MATSKQTRRSISVRGTTYDTLREYCQTHQRSMSDLVEEQLAKLFDQKSVSVKTAPRASRATVAPKVLRAPAPVAQPAEGRPKPVDAREVIPARVQAPKGDYRTIDF